MNLKSLLLLTVIGVFTLACQLTAFFPSAQEQPTEIINPTSEVQATNVPPALTLAVAIIQSTATIQPLAPAQTQPARAQAVSSPTTAQKSAAAPTSTATLRATATSTRASISTATPKPAATTTQTTQAGCVANAPQAKPSSLIKSVTIGSSTSISGDITPKSEFTPNSIVYVVVVQQNAPANTEIKAKWYATDTNGTAACNTLIGEVPYSNDPTPENIRFSQGPIAPIGKYLVEIYVNNTLDRVVTFTIK